MAGTGLGGRLSLSGRYSAIEKGTVTQLRVWKGMISNETSKLRRMVARSKASVSHAGGREFETASGLHPRFDAS